MLVNRLFQEYCKPKIKKRMGTAENIVLADAPPKICSATQLG